MSFSTISFSPIITVKTEQKKDGMTLNVSLLPCWRLKCSLRKKLRVNLAFTTWMEDIWSKSRSCKIDI